MLPLSSEITILRASVDSESAKEIIRKLWYLDTIDKGKPILFVINSPGGSVDAGFAIWDQIKLIAEDKMVDLNAFTVESAMSMVAGTARSMGLKVSGNRPF